MRIATLLLLLSMPSVAAGCSEEPPTGEPSATATTPRATSANPTPASGSAEPLPPRSDCPKDSSGPGTLKEPCAGKGSARMMDAKWNGKIDDKGPYFNVTNNSPKVILYGEIAVYFYDKAGKQLEVQDKGKAAPFKTCTGNIFGGVMKVKEKALLTFSCVKKSAVPEGAAAIEAELVSVGFSDENEQKSEFYWANRELAPAVRPKGGTK